MYKEAKQTIEAEAIESAKESFCVDSQRNTAAAALHCQILLHFLSCIIIDKSRYRAS
jgi:hypothetical protein